MRILPLIAALLMTGSAFAATADKSAEFNLSDDAGNVFGDYLSARFAAEHHDFNEAAKFYKASLERDPSDQQLLTYTFFYSASAGQIEDDGPKARILTAANLERLFGVKVTLAQRDGFYHGW